jgi:hypothetical protein
MLPESMRQERLSVAYFHAVLATCGVNFSRDACDLGMDYYLNVPRYVGGRFVPGTDILGIQLKSTRQATVGEEVVSYRLDLRAYDILRATDVSYPALLVLLVLPTDPHMWVTATEKRLVLRHCAYWVSLRGAKERRPPGRAKSPKVSIEIPRTHQFTVRGLKQIMRRFEAGDDMNSPRVSP